MRPCLLTGQAPGAIFSALLPYDRNPGVLQVRKGLKEIPSARDGISDRSPNRLTGLEADAGIVARVEGLLDLGGNPRCLLLRNGVLAPALKGGDGVLDLTHGTPLAKGVISLR